MTWKPGHCHKFEFTIGIDRRGSFYLDFGRGDVWDQRMHALPMKATAKIKKDDWHHLAIVNARYSQKGEVVARESQATH